MSKQEAHSIVNPTMLILARESRELTQVQLAEQVGLTQVDISRYESGARNIGDEHLRLIADALRYPLSFFYRSGQRFGLGSSGLYHRKRKTLPDRKLDSLITKVNIFRLNLSELMRSVDITDTTTFPTYDLDEYGGDIERIAEQVRAAWKLPSGPINDLVGVIENAGGVVQPIFVGTQKIDALVQWIKPGPPIFLINEDFPGDRMRFTLAHEIAHLVLHDIPTAYIEREADAFASAFLMPARDILPELAPVNLQHLAQLKLRWRVSIAALIRRARDLKQITERQYRSLNEDMGRLGYRTQEPNPISIEKPTLLKEIIEAHINELRYSVRDIADMLSLHEDELRDQYLPRSYQIRLVPTLRRIPLRRNRQ